MKAPAWLTRWLRRRDGSNRTTPGDRRGSPLPDVGAPVTARASCTVLIPALNEAARIAEVVRYALGDEATGEVAWATRPPARWW